MVENCVETLTDEFGDTIDEKAEEKEARMSIVPPWYIRGLWSQSLLGDLGGSIRLSLSKLPTLQL